MILGKPLMTVDTTALGQMQVKTRSGQDVSLSTAWAQKPAVLVWLRHFG